MRSPYSILEGALKITETAERAARYRQPALAITDTNNLCGALEFCEKVSAEGVQPIIGVTLNLDLEGPRQPGQIHKDPDGTLVLLAQDETGYGSLMDLSSASYLEIEATDTPHIKASRLEGWTESVIALTGGQDGVLNRLIKEGRLNEAESWLTRLKAFMATR